MSNNKLDIIMSFLLKNTVPNSLTPSTVKTLIEKIREAQSFGDTKHTSNINIEAVRDCVGDNPGT